MGLCAAAGAQSPSTQAEYQALLAPPLQQRAVVERASFRWDALQFRLRSGSLALAGPAGKPAVAAVFVGAGELDVLPPNAIARQQMEFLLHAPSIAVPFSAAVFRFQSAAQFRQVTSASVHFHAGPAETGVVSVLRDRANVVTGRGLDDVARQMLALDSGVTRSPGWFLAALKTRNGWVRARYDPLDAEAVKVSEFVQRAAFGAFVFQDVWAHFAGGSEAAGTPGSVVPLAAPDRLDDYHLSMQIPGNLDMEAQASWTATARQPGRGLLLQLDPNLRVLKAALANGAPIGFMQPPDPGRTPDPFYQGNWLYLQLPQALTAGQSVGIAMQYHGKYVIEEVGEGNFFAESMGWYPSNSFGPPFQRASYHMEFSNQDKYTLVATGVRQSEQVKNDEEISEWASPVPLTVAGFALGGYKEISQQIKLPGGQKVAVDVYSNKNPDDMMAAINIANEMPRYVQGNEGTMRAPEVPIGTLNTTHLAKAAMTQVSAALQFMTELYGPYPYPSLAVVPIPYPYGQGWPGLLYLSDLSFLDSTQLDALGVSAAGMNQLSDTFRAHETSHQWWGHRVGWASYHDQWLSEGLANGSALLFQMAADGEKAGLQTLEQWRRELESKNILGHVHDADGAMWLGRRLASSEDPAGYQIITYDKGGYVLYMLRQMLLDTSSANPNAAFVAMMKDFTSTYANRDASTADFQHIVEKHMDRAMDVEGDHTMNWFFQEYVYRTGIPQLGFHAAWARDGAHYKLTMTIDNPSNWQGVLPVYIWAGKKFLRGQLAVRQPQETVTLGLGFEPSKVVANEFLDMLADVKQ